MIINLDQHLKQQKIKPIGVIHIGGHHAQEYQEYVEMGLKNQIWIEAIPSFYEMIQSKIKDDPNCMVFNNAIFDSEQILTFNVANNGASSSLLQLKEHKKYYPYITYDNTFEVKTKRLDTLISENNIDIKKYNGLSIDVQGAELNVLKSLGNLLSNFQFVLTEINVEELYENCCLVGDLDSYLEQYEFKRVDTKLWDEGAVGWGDALYIKNSYLL